MDGLRPVVDFDSIKWLKSNGSNLTCSMGLMPDDLKTTATSPPENPNSDLVHYLPFQNKRDVEINRNKGELKKTKQ